MSKEEAIANLEKAVFDYMVVMEDGRDTTGLMLEGFVMQVVARTIVGGAEGYTSNNWTMMDSQSVATTVGLATILHENVIGWYRSGITLDGDDK